MKEEEYSCNIICFRRECILLVKKEHSSVCLSEPVRSITMKRISLVLFLSVVVLFAVRPACAQIISDWRLGDMYGASLIVSPYEPGMALWDWNGVTGSNGFTLHIAASFYAEEYLSSSANWSYGFSYDLVGYVDNDPVITLQRTVECMYHGGTATAWWKDQSALDMHVEFDNKWLEHCVFSYEGVEYMPEVLFSRQYSFNGQNASVSYLANGVSVNALAHSPEPGTLALIGVGLAGLGGMARRKTVAGRI